MTNIEQIGFVKLRCNICNELIETIDEYMQVPIVDPFESVHSADLCELIGKPVHVRCWANSDYWSEVARLAIAGFNLDFKDGIALADSLYAGIWIKNVPGAPSAAGLLFLPRSAYIYDNLFGMDVKGGVVAGAAHEIAEIAKFLMALKFPNNEATSHRFRTSAKAMGEISITPSSVVGWTFLDMFDIGIGGERKRRFRVSICNDDLRLLNICVKLDDFIAT